MTIQIGLFLFPKITQLDLTAPFEVLSRLPEAKVSLFWKSRDAVTSGSGLTMLPTATLADSPQFDVLCVPGGRGLVPLLEDAEVLEFLHRQAVNARYVSAVCTGSLLLGAAGLLDGYRATTHWAYHDLLSRCGALPVRQRVVVDRNRITAGGVTAGIDFGLRLAAEMCGERVARGIQLGLEYDPEPPFDSGCPERTDPEIVQLVRGLLRPSWQEYDARLAQR